MPSQQSVICAICHDHLLRGFDDVGSAHAVVRLNACGHMLHRSCVQTWYASKAEKGRIPDCPCCNAPIDERPESFRVCFFSQGDDDGGLVEAVAPQEILLALTPATRSILELLAMLHELRPRLEVTDRQAYDDMIDQLDLDAWNKNPEPGMVKEIREKLDKVVAKVGEMWAVETTRNHLEQMMESFEKWKHIADSFKRTRKNQTEFRRVHEARIDQNRQLKELSDKLKRQKKELHWQHVKAIEEQRKLHREQLAEREESLNEELRRLNAKWKERNSSLQAQLDHVKADQKADQSSASDAIERQLSAKRLAMTAMKRELDHNKLELASQKRKCRDLEIELEQYRRSHSRSRVLHGDKPSVLLDGVGDSTSGLEVTGTLGISDTEGSEDEDSFVLNPYPEAGSYRLPPSRMTEPTKREIKVKMSRGARKTQRASSSFSVLTETTEANEVNSADGSPVYPASTRLPQARHDTGRSRTISCSSLKFEHKSGEDSDGLGVDSAPDSIDLDDPFLSSQQSGAGPSVQLASGPRYRPDTTTTTNHMKSNLDKKRSLSTFLDDPGHAQRACGEKRRIRAVPPKRQHY